MVGKEWLQPPRRVLTGFLGVVVVCVGALAWLGHRLLEQDRALEDQRLQEQLEHAADLAAATLKRELSELERLLDGVPRQDGLPDGAILVVAGALDVERYGAVPLLFYPGLEAPAEVSHDSLQAGERIEFQGNDALRAAAAFREIAPSREPALRAAALVRLSRALRKAGHPQEALHAYSELAALGATLVLGLPAELVAQEARCTTLDASGRRDELRREATALLRDLETGRWRLTRGAYEFRAEEARRWIGDASRLSLPTEALALSDAAETIVTEWRSRPEAPGGRRLHRSALSLRSRARLSWTRGSAWR